MTASETGDPTTPAAVVHAHWPLVCRPMVCHPMGAVAGAVEVSPCRTATVMCVGETELASVRLPQCPIKHVVP